MDHLSSFHSSNLLHTQEEMRRYKCGGFHPVCLGDTFKDGRYQVHHKLSWGGFSTVWLARDVALKKWVSLKIIMADTPNPSQELQILQSLRQKRAAHHIVRLLDYFIHQGPNGSHQCLVLELLGPSVDFVVADYKMGGDRLEATTILRVTRQLLKAIASIHAAGYAHGDISGSNLVFTARKLSRSSAKTIFKTLGSPVSERLAYRDNKPLLLGMPEQLVEKAGWVDWIDEDDEDVRVIDLGEAFPHGTEPVNLAEPGDMQVPERIFTGNFDYKVDLWRAGCTWILQIYTMVFGSRPFQFLSEIDVLVAQMINFIEELPVEWTAEWERLKKTSGREWDNIPNQEQMLGPSKLEERFQQKGLDASLAPLLPIMQGLMRFQPSDRISAVEALRLLDV